MKRNNGGFTLVELLVTIAISSVVLAAAASLLLLGMRIQRAAQKEAGEQQTVRIVLSALEDLSASGRIYRVEPLSDGWQLQGRDDTGAPGAVLLRYGDGKLTSGANDENVLLDGLRGARVELDGGGLLTFTFRTEAHSYSTSVFCRTGVKGDSAGSAEALDKVKDPGQKDSILPTTADLTEAEKAARYAFLQTLANEYGSTGKITGKITGSSQYYSEWYIDGYDKDPRWNEDTPWCGCFLSWGADQLKNSINGEPPRFANVDEGKKKFKDGSYGQWRDRGATPVPGDYVFFDWDGGTDPDHVGAVLCVENGKVYTIEGNSGGKVAVHSYSLNDPRIVGYGILDWCKGE